MAQETYRVGENCVVQSQIPLSGLTSFRVGGPAEWLVFPRQLSDLQASLEWAKQRDLPITFLGAGSNLLISDRGLPGLVVCTRYLRQAEFDESKGQVWASAGEPLATLAWKAAKRGWQGLEWAVGIPGTVGGAVVMNAGAHGACTADILVSADILDPSGNCSQLYPEDLGFQYRTSVLQGDSRLVTHAVLQLKPGSDRQAVMAATAADLKQRRTTQPYHLPSCGSVFRNPTPHSAGWLIEQAGLKGYQIGNAQVSTQHANFILNCGGATASDILRLIRHVQHQVETRWALPLKPEVKILGEFQLA
ncbi:UDP-N-acetylmuramate dehydrogenase [Almyronema epifaneia]|uniref:UDP-N-acetylenolpyruvoylglucosamine reductase n=1 Tax=Almyronema epifaneia S1 TaxID=2991925 RepID=A0ABW6IHI0_9CYAN